MLINAREVARILGWHPLTPTAHYHGGWFPRPDRYGQTGTPLGRSPGSLPHLWEDGAIYAFRDRDERFLGEPEPMDDLAVAETARRTDDGLW